MNRCDECGYYFSEPAETLERVLTNRGSPMTEVTVGCPVCGGSFSAVQRTEFERLAEDCGALLIDDDDGLEIIFSASEFAHFCRMMRP